MTCTLTAGIVSKFASSGVAEPEGDADDNNLMT